MLLELIQLDQLRVNDSRLSCISLVQNVILWLSNISQLLSSADHPSTREKNFISEPHSMQNFTIFEN